jgi:adenine-specific DNA-methyltransferase
MTNNNNQKLELTWVGKNNPEYDIANIEPRILEEKPELSNCVNDPHTENMIIHGDNLLALKALLPEYEGKVKCIYIDPPYNTGNAFEHYDDSVEHSTWLSLMKPRLELLYQLLHEDGLLVTQIDDNEFAKLYILLSEVFAGEKNLKTIVVKMSEASGLKMGAVKKAGIIPKYKEYLILAKKIGVRNLKPRYIKKEEWDKEYNIFIDNFTKNQRQIIDDISDKNEISDIDLSIVDSLLNGVSLRSIVSVLKELEIKKDNEKDWLFENAWRIARSAASSSIFKLSEEKKRKINQVLFSVKSKKEGLLYIVKSDYRDDSKQPRVQLLFADLMLMSHPGDLWMDIKTTGLEAEGMVEFKKSKKPEALLERIIEMCCSKNELVLDSFLGSGTTAAVAHKMGRKYIGIEMGDHAYTHCKLRLDMVIDGTDQGGISKVVDWKGGGAYKFYELAPSFIVKDEFGNPVIDGYYNDAKLIQAMCKLMNFTYQPSHSEYWKHGLGQGKNYIYVTTQLLSTAMVQQIAAHLATGETLLICPKKFEPGAEKIDSRITIKKIPQSVLKACHFGKKEYLLPIKESEIEEIDFDEENND